MIYISFDIGIKNLALCILKKTDKIEVLDWRIIAIAESKKELKGIDDISERVYNEMDIIVGFLKEANINMIDYVLIENQPSNTSILSVFLRIHKAKFLIPISKLIYIIL